MITKNIELKSLSNKFIQDVYKIPEGKKIKKCIQCGTCSASCPTSHKMDYTPREIIAAFRAGMLEKVLKSNTVWICTSCYYCTVRCPSGIKLTDIMYELKRLGIDYGIYPKGVTSPVLANTFVEIVDKYGRNHEPELLLKYFIRTSPLGLLKMVPKATKLFLKGRISLFPKKIKGHKDLKKLSEWFESRGNK